MGTVHSCSAPLTRPIPILDRNLESARSENFEVRWKRFIESLDIPNNQVRNVESLDENKKLELLLSFEAKNSEHSVSHYINTIKNFDWGSLLSPKKRDSGSDLRSLLLSTEISLRTDSVGWVYEFLSYDGLDILQDFMSTCLEIIFWPDDFSRRRNHLPDSSGLQKHFDLESSQSKLAVFHSHFNCNPLKDENDKLLSGNFLPSLTSQKIVNALDNPALVEITRKCASRNVKSLLKDCLHLSLRCLKTILNNQHGCKQSLEHSELLFVLTFCLFHPNYATKALTLDILTALCLIEGGHSRVLHSFDRLRNMMGEGLRFETLLGILRYHEEHETENYNLEFSVACVQFFNIVVHCSENINLRVYLQHEMFLLGLDDILKKLRPQADDRLKTHIEAYLDNRVDCSVLLEDAEAKESAVIELERVQHEWLNKVHTLEKNLRAEMEADFKAREVELLSLVESLRTRIRDLNVTSWDRENAIKYRMEELNKALQASRIEVAQLQAAIESIKSSSSGISSVVTTNSMATSTNFETDLHVSQEFSSSQKQLPSCPILRHCSLRSNSFDVNYSAPGNSNNQAFSSELDSEADRKKCATGPLGKHTNGPRKPIRKLPHADPHPRSRVDEHPCSNLDMSSIRQFALRATGTLSQLLQDTPRKDAHPLINSIVPPIGWKPVGCNFVKNSIFERTVLETSMSLHPLSPSIASSNLWTTCAMHLAEPWFSAAQACDASFVRHSDVLDDLTEPSPYKWLSEIGLLPCGFIKLLSSPDAHLESLSLKDYDLIQKLTRFELKYSVAQRLLHQLRSESLPISDQTSLFSLTEAALESLIVCSNPATKAYPTAAENHWFWTSSFLHITLVTQLWSLELQRIAENLSALLAGYMSILVSSKLPIILHLVMEFASHVTVNWNCGGFKLQSLDALLEWTLPSVTQQTTLQPPVDDGPPTYSAATDETDKRWKPNASFVHSFYHLVSGIAPNLLDWPDELNHLEAASQFSLTEAMDRIKLLEMVCDIWHHLIVSNPKLQFLDPQSSDRYPYALISKQLVQLRQAAEYVGTIGSTTAHWLLQCPLQISTSTTYTLPPGWLTPLIRFAAAFKHLASESNMNCRNQPDVAKQDSVGGSSHLREQRQRRSEPQSGGNKREHRRKKHRTRQLDADGIMDDILAGLNFQPLRADLHTKRTETEPQTVIP